MCVCGGVGVSMKFIPLFSWWYTDDYNNAGDKHSVVKGCTKKGKIVHEHEAQQVVWVI